MDLSFVINTVYPIENAAYAISGFQGSAPWTLPDGFASARPIRGASIFGLVTWHPVNDTLVLAFRGTETKGEWLRDFEAAAVPCTVAPSLGFVHAGFQDVYLTLRDSVHGLVHPAHRVIVTGHSLGAALAILCAADLAINLHVVPEVTTFAGPRVCTVPSSKEINARVPSITRIVNHMDVVPNLPAPPLFEHVGSQVLVHGGWKATDVAYAHHLTTYLAGLQALEKQS